MVGDITLWEPEAGDGVEIDAYSKEYLSIDLQCRNTRENAGFIDLPLLYYKGYSAVDADSGNRLEVCAGENNVVRVLIPMDYNGSLKIRFVPPGYWRISELVSTVSLISMLAVLGNKALRRRKVRNESRKA